MNFVRPLVSLLRPLVPAMLVGTLVVSCGQTPEATDAPRAAANSLTDRERADGWRLLFDGESTDEWRAFRGEEFPARGWVVEGGALRCVAGGGGGDIITVDKFADFEFAFDWKVGAGANSGVIYRTSEEASATYATGPEYQVLDDGPGTEDAPVNNDSVHTAGLYALYGTTDKVLLPAGEWNTGRVVVVGNRVEHWLNGRLVVEAKMHSPDWYARVKASKFDDMPLFGTVGLGHIALQDHGDDVWYRNLRIRERSLEEEQGGEPVAIFDGETLAGLDAFLIGDVAMEDVWSVDDGVLVCRGEPAGYIYTTEKYTNFVLELEWRWDPVEKKAGNSGVLFRRMGEHRVWPKSIEAQLMSGRAGDFWNIGGVAMTTDPDRANGGNTKHRMAAENPVGAWNRYRIICNRGKVELYVNGELVNQAWEAEEVAGEICLQSEGAPIHFRNARLVPLK